MARSQTFHDTNGVDQEWEVSFTGGYLSREHVSAYFYQTGNLEDPRQPVSFTWVTDNLIRITPALADGGKLLIQRATPIDQSIVRFTDIAKLTKQDLQTAADQAVLAIAELVDQYEDPDLLNALADARTAAETATLAGDAAGASAEQAAASKDAAVAAQAVTLAARDYTLDARDFTVGVKDEAVAAKNAAEAAAANNAKTNAQNTFSTSQRVAEVVTSVVDYGNPAHVQGIPNLAWVEGRVGVRGSGQYIRGAATAFSTQMLTIHNNTDTVTVQFVVQRADSADAFPRLVLGDGQGTGAGIPNMPSGVGRYTRLANSTLSGYTVAATRLANGAQHWTDSGAAPSSAVTQQTYTVTISVLRYASGRIGGYSMRVLTQNSEFSTVCEVTNTSQAADTAGTARTDYRFGLYWDYTNSGVFTVNYITQ